MIGAARFTSPLRTKTRTRSCQAIGSIRKSRGWSGKYVSPAPVERASAAALTTYRQSQLRLFGQVYAESAGFDAWGRAQLPLWCLNLGLQSANGSKAGVLVIRTRSVPSRLAV